MSHTTQNRMRSSPLSPRHPSGTRSLHSIHTDEYSVTTDPPKSAFPSACTPWRRTGTDLPFSALTSAPFAVPLHWEWTALPVPPLYMCSQKALWISLESQLLCCVCIKVSNRLQNCWSVVWKANGHVGTTRVSTVWFTKSPPWQRLNTQVFVQYGTSGRMLTFCHAPTAVLLTLTEPSTGAKSRNQICFPSATVYIC